MKKVSLTILTTLTALHLMFAGSLYKAPAVNACSSFALCCYCFCAVYCEGGQCYYQLAGCVAVCPDASSDSCGCWVNPESKVPGCGSNGETQ